jgi:diadenosine tetraphosphatase ApaH/serine/threonine PP2A family protein phosphatase
VLALLYDVHGNLPALEAVLSDSPAEQHLLGGDYAVAGAWPVECVERLRELDATWIRGNTERWLVDRSDAPEPMHGAIDLCRRALGDATVEELTALPGSVEREDALFCHASPPSDMASFGPEAADADAELVEGVEPELVVFGHTHVQFERTGPRGVRLVNPGSVGMPFDGDHRAAYALLDDRGRVELRRVEYDWRASAAATRERVGELPARRIELARLGVD